jgi:hypothetical protein
VIERPYQGNTDAVLSAISAERDRQESLKAAGRFMFTCADDAMTDGECLAVLVEEIGEVAHEINEVIGKRLTQGKREAYRERLRTELIQVAAVATAWVERIDGELT